MLAEYEQPGLPVLFTINGEQWPDNRPVHVTRGDIEIWEARFEGICTASVAATCP